MPLNNPTPSLDISGTETSISTTYTLPVAWTDYDLSGTIGTGVKEVTLSFSAGLLFFVAVRQNGTSVDPYNAIQYPGGLAVGYCDGTNPCVVQCYTDSSGIIEICASAARNPTTIILHGYKEANV